MDENEDRKKEPKCPKCKDTGFVKLWNCCHIQHGGVCECVEIED